MTDPVQIALIVAMPPTITAVAGLVVSLLNRRQALKAADLAVKATQAAQTAAEVAVETSAKLDTVHEQINGRMGELLEATKKAGVANGIAQEKGQK